MQSSILNKRELQELVKDLPNAPVVALLLGGDRLRVCDEGVVIKLKNEVVGIATIAPLGEDNSGKPTIVAVYILPDYRRKGYSTPLLDATIKRCLKRGFNKVRVDVLSGRLMKTIQSLPGELKLKLDIHDLGTVMDAIPG